jgi:hypothetical protein
MAEEDKFKPYIDGFLRRNLDFLVERIENAWDLLLLIDGLERAGKTTLGKTAAAYLAFRLKREFTANNIFFDIDDLIEFAQNNRNKIIMWDEAALGGLSQQWATADQLKLKQLLITCGKFGHVLIFIVPDFTILNKYFSVNRSFALLRVYSPDNITRGFFEGYDVDSKKLLYDAEKKGLYFNHGIKPTIKGVFAKNDGIVDEVLYEKRKDEAIAKIGTTEKNSAKNKLANCVYAAKLIYNVPIQFFSNVLGMKHNNLSAEITLCRNAGNLASDGDIRKAVDNLGKISKTQLTKFQMPGAEAEGEE